MLITANNLSIIIVFFITAEKEIEAVQKDANTKEQQLSGKEERTRVTVETDELHSALVNHRIIRDVYQTSVFNTQVIFIICFYTNKGQIYLTSIPHLPFSYFI